MSRSGARAAARPGSCSPLTGIGFKLGVVPFHLWTPDVYQGAPAPVAAFVAATSKSAMVALLLRHFSSLRGASQPRRCFSLAVIAAIASMCAGNLLGAAAADPREAHSWPTLPSPTSVHTGRVPRRRRQMAVEAVSFYVTAYTAILLAAFES